MKLVIVGAEFGKFCKVDLLLLECFAVDSRELDVVQFPVKLDVLASADLLGRVFHNF
jgi:hypothetical protein